MNAVRPNRSWPIVSLLSDSRTRVFTLLKSREEEIHRVSTSLRYLPSIAHFQVQLSQALVKYETLDADDVRRAVRGEPLRVNDVSLLEDG